MNKQPPLHDAQNSLDAEERDLAKIVRALPGGEPPSALDALILKSASDAVSSSSQSKRSTTRAAKGLLGSGMMWLGTAAASILTAGVGWQVYQSIRAPVHEISVYAPPDVVMQESAPNQSNSMVIEMEPASEPAPALPPPVADMQAPERDAVAKAPAAPRTQAPAMAKAESDRSANVFTEAKKQSAPAEDWVSPAPVSAPATNTASGALADMAAPVAAAPPPAAEPIAANSQDAYAAAESSKELEQVAVTGSRLRRVAAETTAPASVIKPSPSADKSIIEAQVAKDAQLAPLEWLNAVKKRRDEGDLAGAKASLKKFQDTYPRNKIPNELKPLLR
jgi:resuscitation-promoting factor RpfA